jgi:hypothetical protein
MHTTPPSSVCFSFLATVLATASALAGPVTWRSQQLCQEFHAEGATAGDFNKDGKQDIAYGPFWWAGPDFRAQHQIYAPTPFDPRGYSKNFVAYAPDLNKDGWDDVLVLGFPGEASYWFANPQGKAGDWARHDILKVTDNESPMWTDITGDGKPEIVCSSGGFFGYAAPGEDPTKLWEFTKVSGNAAGGRFTHGLGVGDVNGDKRPDLLEKNGYWLQPVDARTQPEWTHRPVAFSGPGGAHMFASDVDADGDADIFTSLAAHGYGLAWFEQKDGAFERHLLMAEDPSGASPSPSYSQLHAIDMGDIDGDGTADFVTGKRYWAHAPKPDGTGGDGGVNDPAVLYWYQVKPGKKSGVAEFVPHLIHGDSGVGTQVMLVDVDGNGSLDVVSGSKKGAWVHFSQGAK